MRRDLAVLGRSSERHLAEKVTLAIVGLLLVPACAGLLALAGTTLPLALPLWGSLVCGLAGFVLPDLGIHSEAEARRRDFRHALGSFLDLVVIALAGGGGVETALGDAASIGEGWAFDELRHSLDAARLARDTPWSALERLGNELGVAELGELAASVGLAGAEGAKVRASLGAKAASLALPSAGRGRDDRPGGHREDEPPRRAALRRVPLLHRLPGHRARPGRTVTAMSSRIPKPGSNKTHRESSSVNNERRSSVVFFATQHHPSPDRPAPQPPPGGCGPNLRPVTRPRRSSSSPSSWPWRSPPSGIIAAKVISTAHNISTGGGSGN